MRHARSSGLSLGCVWLPVAAAIAILGATPATALAQGGAAASWGENYRGQLGTFYRSLHEERPVAVEGLPNVSAVAAAASFNLALLSNGTVVSWGGNAYGQLGDGGYKATWELGESHVPVSGLSGVSAIAAANEHALALLTNGTVKAWGNNQYGELGDGTGGFEERTGQNERVPKTVPGLTGVVAVATGGGSNFALLGNGTVRAWGNNVEGQLGTEWPEQCQKRNSPGCAQYECPTEVGNELCGRTPQPVMKAKGMPLSEVVAISAGEESAYALLKDGQVLSWGGDFRGQLGQVGVETGPHGRFIPPGKVMRSSTEALEHVQELSAGADHVLVRLLGGQAFGWGDNERGELGKPGLAGVEICQVHVETPCFRVAKPIRALRGRDVEAVSAGSHYSLALIAHQVYAWGKNEYGELGDGRTTDNHAPTLVEGLGPVAAMSAANTHAVALLEPGSEPPHPVVSLEPQEGALKVAWTSDEAEREVYRVFERPGANEAEGESDEAEGMPGSEEGPPRDTTRPRIKGEARDGQALTATMGTWTGTEPMTEEVQWQRCRNHECLNIAGATGSTYLLGSQDAGSTLDVIVTAANSLKPPGTAISPPTRIVKTKQEATRSTPESITLNGTQHSDVLDEFDDSAPLESVPYEIKFRAGEKTRVMVGTPLPALIQ